MTTIKSRKLVSIITIIALVITLIAATGVKSSASTYTGKYWLKINKKASVITAYQRINGKYVPIRAMLCSCGAVGTPTPSGTFYGGYKSRWLHMVDEHKSSTYEQYTMLVQSSSQIYIHSVWYYSHNHAAQSQTEFNKLGSRASHGCIRTSTMDAKWIYDHCKVGTKITIYSSKKAGPLGKPKAIHSSSSWDPTDPVKSNPYFHMPRPVITISKSKASTVQYGSNYKLKSKVTVKDPNTFMNITKYLKVSAVYKYSTAKGMYVRVSKFSTKSLGKYKIKYYVNDPYGSSKTKYYKIKVVDTAKPTISGAASKSVTTSDPVNLLDGVTANQATADRTSSIVVTVRTPDGSTTSLTKSQAMAYKFTKLGHYRVNYSVANKYNSSAKASKTITITREYQLPDYVGQVYSDTMKSDLAKLGLTNVTVTELPSSTVAKGTVISMTPAGGTWMSSDDTITITVSSGPATN